MGVRIFPANDNNRKLMEEFAGVPAGTFARLTELEEQFEGNSDGLFEALYSGSYEDENIMHNFLLNGWGKFKSINAVQILESGGHNSIVGSSNNEWEIRAVVRFENNARRWRGYHETAMLPSAEKLMECDGIWWG